MRVKTIKRGAILIAVLSLIAGTGFFTQRFQVTRLAKAKADEADDAVKKGKFAKAEQLYREHLMVVPSDDDIREKYADALLKAASLPSKQQQFEALQIYASIIRRNPGDNDVRRKQMELKVAMGRFHDDRGGAAEEDLKTLLKADESENDGKLLFLMGRCCEEGKNDEAAVTWYRKAIEHNAPQQIEAYQRLATLLRGQLNQPTDADQAIEEMVQSAPKNYLVYLERGRYRRQFDLPESGADFRKASELAEASPEVYLEMAKTVETDSGFDTARKILEDGLKKAPASAEIYTALTDLEWRSGHADQAVKILERGLKSAAKKKDGLHLLLANILAARGDTSTLRLQIEELRKIGYPDPVLQLFSAHYYINSSDFRKARELLVPLESIPADDNFKARVNDLLARCYSQLGEPGMQQEAYLRALRHNPHDIQAKQGLIDRMVEEGEIDRAIKEYYTLVQREPRVKLDLAKLLIERNRLRPGSQRDWSEVKGLLDDVEKSLPQPVDEKSSPQSVELPVVRAEFYVMQNKFAEASDELNRAQQQFPKSVVIWAARAGLLGVQKRFDEGQSLLDQARNLLGDHDELRLARAKLSVTKGGPQVVRDLNELAKNLEPFSKQDRRNLLNGLAIALKRQQDLQGAIRLWSQLAEQEPNDLDLRLNLLDLAFQTANSDEIDKNIKQIGEIEGGGGSLGRYCQVRYLIWQAQRLGAKDPQEAQRLRTRARVLLNELASRRPNWSVIPFALAQLEQQELRQGGLTDREIQAKEESIIRSYRRAIDLGERSKDIVRETVMLLFKNKRGSEALDLLNSISVASQLARDLGRQVMQFAVESQDFQRAEEVARKVVKANPDDFQERIWLVQVLLASGNPDKAESEIRQAVDLSKKDPNRWMTLVRFFVLTKKPAKAAEAIKDAEAALPASEAPLALAQCCERWGSAYDKSDDGTMNQWYAKAKEWYDKARVAHPDDFSIKRHLTDFYRRTRQIVKVKDQLRPILNTSSSQSAETRAWARRTLALTLAASSDPQRIHEALSILDQGGQVTSGALPANALEDPEDLRVRAYVLNAQKTKQRSKEAIGILELLIDKNQAKADDRVLLARLYEANGDWPKAQETYRELNLRTKTTRDIETVNHRPIYLAEFVTGLLRNHKGSDDQMLVEAQDLVDELKQLQPDQLRPLVLEVEVNRARNQLDKALDLCKPLWANPRTVELAATTCVGVIGSSNADRRQVDRVAGWLEDAIKQKTDSAILAIGLANCRERQELYDEAKTLYEGVIKQSLRNAAAPSEPNNLVATAYNNLAWLLALKYKQGDHALVEIDRADQARSRRANARLSRHPRCRLLEFETDKGRHQGPRDGRRSRSLAWEVISPYTGVFTSRR